MGALHKHFDALLYHNHHDPHQQASELANVILGGQDGLVNVLGVVLGVAAAAGDPRIVIAAGLAATFAESVSMGAVAYTSTQAEADYYESELKREYRHIQQVPELEAQEIRDIFARHGFDGEMLEHIVETITANRDVWVAVMMTEEHRLQSMDSSTALRSAIVVGLSAVVGSLVPLIPFFFLPIATSIGVSIFLTALVLFGVGAYKARVTIGRPLRSGIEMAIIGTISALVGYFVGLLFQSPTVP